MKKELKYFGIAAVAFVFLLLGVFVINQINSVYNLANGLNPVFGQVVLYGLGIFAVGIVIVPVVYVLRLPGRLHPPKDEDSQAYQDYLNKVRQRLETNPVLQEENADPDKQKLGDREFIKDSVSSLNKQANDIIEDISGFVFVSTAVSQNGVFDAVIVLIAQLRMVWQIAHLYNQRPSLKELAKLYINVAATVFIVRGIEDFELLEDQLEPVIASVLGSSLGGMVPWLNTASVVMVNSIVQGSANTFLTLRVGVISKKYSKPLQQDKPKAKIRKSASSEACLMLGRVLGKSVKVVTRSVYNASKNASKSAGQAGKDRVVNIAEESKNIANKIICKIKN